MNILNFIGNTPILEICDGILLKLEMKNPTGSVKDRAAYHILKSEGLPRGSNIVEATSGNFGISLAMLSAVMGYNFTAVMPHSASPERESLIQAYGGSVVRCDSMADAVALAEKVEGFKPRQFTNTKNPEAHYLTTGPEIWHDTDGAVDILVAGVGSGGTLMGTGRFLKERNPALRIIAVEPEASPMLSLGKAGKHSIEGIGANFLPPLFDRSLVDEIVLVSDADADRYALLLAQKYGIFAGPSSGAALCAALKIRKKREERIAVILPDNGYRYLTRPDFLVKT